MVLIKSDVGPGDKAEIDGIHSGDEDGADVYCNQYYY